VARGTQHLKRRTPANAGVAATTAATPKSKRPVQHAKWEDQLFFGRLRVHAKWLFALLAVVFGLGFVLLGVGSGSTGIGSALQNFFQGFGGSGSSGSTAALVKKTTANPKDAAAWLALATKYQTDNRDDDAISALSTYTTLKPKDSNALTELGGLYLRRATDWETVYQAQSAQTEALVPSSPFQPTSTSQLGKAFASLKNPIQSAVQSTTGTSTQTAYEEVLTYLNQRLTVYQTLAKLSPKDANIQYELAQAAQDAGNSKVAITGYTKFLKLAPEDSLAATARKTLKQLKAASAATAG
jgi:tetratricopeptide (TPR) repeat protein